MSIFQECYDSRVKTLGAEYAPMWCLDKNFQDFVLNHPDFNPDDFDYDYFAPLFNGQSDFEGDEDTEVNIVNLTPHDLVICGGSVSASGQIARVKMDTETLSPIAGIPVISNTIVGVENLPDSKDDTIYIVSGMVLSALNKSRSDVFAPDTGPTAIRSDRGQIIGVTGLLF